MNLKNFICTLLACIFLLSNTAYALEENRIQTLQLKDIVNEIEKDGINIETELKNQIKMYRDLLENEQDLKEQEKLSSLINKSEELLKCYMENKDKKSPYETRSVDEDVVGVAISAIVAYFNANNYYLSSELLLHAQDNKKLDSTYQPYFDEHVKASKEIMTIRHSSKTSGKGVFEKDNTTRGNDLYYAIHGFSWSRSGSQIIVRDRYDYAVSNYEGIQSYAVNAMFLAQQYGYIVPFQVIIIS